MFTTLSTTRSATSGIEPSVNTDGVAWAGVAPERKTAPVPTRPTTAAAARRLRKAVIFSSGWRPDELGHLWGTVVTNLRPVYGLPLFRESPIRSGGPRDH